MDKLRNELEDTVIESITWIKKTIKNASGEATENILPSVIDATVKLLDIIERNYRNEKKSEFIQKLREKRLSEGKETFTD